VAYPFLPWPRLFNVKSGAVAAEGARAFLVLYTWFILNIPLDVVTRAQAGLQRGYSSLLVSAVGNILSLCGIAVAIGFRANLACLVFASTFGVIAATLANAWCLFRDHPWLLPTRHAYTKKSAHKILKLGALFFVLQCMSAIGFASDNIVIAQVMGAAAVAMYAVPQKLFNLVFVLVNMGIGPLWPAYGEAIASGDVAWVRRIFLKSLRITLAIAAPVCLLLALTGPWILTAVLGKSLHVPRSLFLIFALWGIIYSVSAPIGTLLNGAGVLKLQSICATVASVVNLGLSIFFTRRLGMIGVCMGSIIAQVLISLPVYSWITIEFFQELATKPMGKTLSEIPTMLGP
jgi:O-antigen/teichoic acid export membrane protein